MKIPLHERTNPLWIRLEQHYRERLAVLRAQNDSSGLNAEQTALLRGKIREVRDFLEMVEDAPNIEPPLSQY